MQVSAVLPSLRYVQVVISSAPNIISRKYQSLGQTAEADGNENCIRSRIPSVRQLQRVLSRNLGLHAWSFYGRQTTTSV